MSTQHNRYTIPMCVPISQFRAKNDSSALVLCAKQVNRLKKGFKK